MECSINHDKAETAGRKKRGWLCECNKNAIRDKKKSKKVNSIVMPWIKNELSRQEQFAYISKRLVFLLEGTSSLSKLELGASERWNS